MNMRAGDAASGADPADKITLIDPLPFLGNHFAHVAKHRYDARAVVDHDEIAAEKEVARQCDSASRWRNDWRACWRGDVKA